MSHVQDFLVIPVGAETYSEALRVAVETRSVVQGNLRKRFGKARPAASDSGAFAPVLSTAEEVLGLLSVSVEAAGYTVRRCVSSTLVCLSSTLARYVSVRLLHFSVTLFYTIQDRVKFGIRVSADQFYVSNDVLRLEADLLAKVCVRLFFSQVFRADFVGLICLHRVAHASVRV